MKVYELLREGQGEYWLPKNLKHAKEDLTQWIEDWEEDNRFTPVDGWEKKLPAAAKDYLAYVKKVIHVNVDSHTHEENVVEMRDEGAEKVLTKHKMIKPGSNKREKHDPTKEPPTSYDISYIRDHIMHYNKNLKKGLYKGTPLPLPRSNAAVWKKMTEQDADDYREAEDKFYDSPAFDKKWDQYVEKYGLDFDMPSSDDYNEKAAVLMTEILPYRQFVGPYLRKLFKKRGIA